MAKSGLFENQVQVNLESTMVMIEDVLVELGHVVDKARVEYPECERAWRISKGSATIEIALLVREGAGWLQVSASVMTPGPKTDTGALWRKALLLNAERPAIASFALRGDTVVLIGQRTTLDLDRSEVLALIETVSTDADRYDDELVREFGGRRGD
ncbi:MAG TPA: YbjN domain-containing protein [Kofleriaceae bacterium]|nr:YbjN domain-containing protein [Kofleriaceae bacterium]